jgi:2-C-methyl-D-erythritol 4-phosphate cytidylyltransferase/2-C-methyl-D-erythritol 2,4-cyclodiphosphate synthase
MGSDKLWIDLYGRPIWRWSLDVLLDVPMLTRVCVVAPADALERFRSGLPEAHADRCLLASGGEARADSVAAGLSALAEARVLRDALVLVHDAARPAASVDLMERVVAAAREAGAAAPVVSIADTLTQVHEGVVEATVPRDGLFAAQTPQAASLGMLMDALDAAPSRGIDPTDEATALAAIGVPVRAVPGDAANRKLTEPRDEAVLRAVLRDRAVAGLEAPAVAVGERAGIGFDAHRLEEGGPLRLGGLDFPDERRGLAGHSDGDVALHAVIDALLGAAGLGDVGTLFPSSDERWSGVDSAELVKLTLAKVGAAGMRPVSLDLTVVAARPAIGPVRSAMTQRIAELLGVARNQVSVKGTTSDGLGFGGGEGIAAYTVAVVKSTGS